VQANHLASGYHLVAPVSLPTGSVREQTWTGTQVQPEQIHSKNITCGSMHAVVFVLQFVPQYVTPTTGRLQDLLYT
jgi:hypothetical protein